MAKKDNSDKRNEKLDMINNFEENDLETVSVISLTDEDGETYDFEIIDEMEYKDRYYYAMVEYSDGEDEQDDEDRDILIFRAGPEDEDGLETFDCVDDDDEYLEVGEIFMKRLSRSGNTEDK